MLLSSLVLLRPEPTTGGGTGTGATAQEILELFQTSVEFGLIRDNLDAKVSGVDGGGTVDLANVPADVAYIRHQLELSVPPETPAAFVPALPVVSGNATVVIDASDFGYPQSESIVTFTMLGTAPIIKNGLSVEEKRERPFRTKRNGRVVAEVPLSSSLTDALGAGPIEYRIQSEGLGIDITCAITENTTLIALINAASV